VRELERELSAVIKVYIIMNRHTEVELKGYIDDCHSGF